MSDTEPTLQELLKALQSTNASITSLNQKIEQQAQTIADLKSSNKVSAPEAELTENQQLREQLNKVVDANNKFYAEQRREKLHKTVKDGLILRGIDPKRVDLAMSVVKDKISIDKTGVMKMTDDNGVENVLDEQLTRFCESETGDFFKAPIQSQGAGMTPFQRPNVQTKSFKPTNPAEVQSDSDFNKRIMSVLGFSG